MKRIKRLIKFIKFKYYLWTQRSVFKTHEEDNNERSKLGFKICLELFKHDDSKFTISTKDDNKYLRNETLDIYLIIDNKNVTIITNNCPCSIHMNYRDIERLVYIFNLELDKRRLKSESEIDLKIINSLTNVLNKTKNGK